MAGGAFYAMLSIAAFFTAIWSVGKISKMIGVSSIVLEIAVGIVLGPSVAGLIPSAQSECFTDQTVNCDERKFQEKIANKGYKYCDLGQYVQDGKYDGFWGPSDGGLVVIPGDKGGTYCVLPNSQDCSRRLAESDAVFRLESQDNYTKRVFGVTRRLADDKKGKADYDSYSKCVLESCKLDVALECADVPDLFTLAGHIGVAMMIFESGMHFDFEQARTVGPWACAVAILGTFLPLISGAALAFAYGFDFFPDCLSAGTALAPTSVGIALKLLHEAKALQTYFGQAVMTAAFVDDVLSLILFSILFKLDNVTFMNFLPLILGIVFMFIAIPAAVKVFPPVMAKIFAVVPEYKPNAKVTTHDEVMWLIMFVVFVAYAQITFVCATHLWGCFIAGMSFAYTHHSHHVWVKQVKRVTCWLLRMFFAATLAWAIPIKELFSLEAFWKGTLMGLGPCIASKVFAGPFMGSARWVIGWAMVGRAEFAYFIAILAKSVNMMDEKLFAILVWSLLYATIFAPLIFRYVLKKYMLKNVAKDSEEAKEIEANFSLSGLAVEGHLPDFEGEEIEQEIQIVRESARASIRKSGGRVSRSRPSAQADEVQGEPGSPKAFGSEVQNEKDMEISKLKAEIQSVRELLRKQNEAKPSEDVKPTTPMVSI